MKIIRKVGDMRHGWRGIRAVWREEWHFAYQVAAAASALFISYFLGASSFQMVLLFSMLSFALASEVINTAIEDICNKIEPAHDPTIGKIKDMAQAFVIISALPAFALFVWIVFHNLP